MPQCCSSIVDEKGYIAAAHGLRLCVDIVTHTMIYNLLFISSS